MISLVGTIFSTFFKIGLFTLGGGLAIVSLVQQEMLTRGWLTNAEFLDILGIAQMTPGPIGVNTATFVGYRVAVQHGAGMWTALVVSLVATASVTLPSVLGVHFGGGWFNRNRERPVVRRVFAILRPLVAGFVTARPVVRRVFAILRPLVAGFVTAAGVTLTLDVFPHLAFTVRDAVNAGVFAVTAGLVLTKRFSPLWGLLLGAIAGAVQ